MDNAKRKRKIPSEPAGPSKRRNVGLNSPERDDVTINGGPQPDDMEVIRSPAATYGGNFYKHMTTKDNARAHYGNQIQNNHFSGGNHTHVGYPGTMASSLDPQNAKEILKAFLDALLPMIENCPEAEEFLQPLLRRISRLGQQIFPRVSILEDPHGTPFKIDIGTVCGWLELKALMIAKYDGMRGQQRLQVGKFRLQNRGNTKLINPNMDPNYSDTFAPGKYIKTMMHFGSEEVTLGCCPKCLTKQETLLDAETVCEICHFVYIAEGEVIETQMPVESNDSRYPGFRANDTAATNIVDNDDRPEHFKNVSISALPKLGVLSMFRNVIKVEPSGMKPCKGAFAKTPSASTPFASLGMIYESTESNTDLYDDQDKYDYHARMGSDLGLGFDANADILDLKERGDEVGFGNPLDDVDSMVSTEPTTSPAGEDPALRAQDQIFGMQQQASPSAVHQQRPTNDEMPKMYGRDANEWAQVRAIGGSGPGFEDVQSNSSVGGPAVPMSLNVGDWSEFFGIQTEHRDVDDLYRSTPGRMSILPNTAATATTTVQASANNTGYVPLQDHNIANHSFRDIQMQMMLLEQQNKKRLIMAKRKQDMTSNPTQTGHPSISMPLGFIANDAVSSQRPFTSGRKT